MSFRILNPEIHFHIKFSSDNNMVNLFQLFLFFISYSQRFDHALHITASWFIHTLLANFCDKKALHSAGVFFRHVLLKIFTAHLLLLFIFCYPQNLLCSCRYIQYEFSSAIHLTRKFWVNLDFFKYTRFFKLIQCSLNVSEALIFWSCQNRR